HRGKPTFLDVRTVRRPRIVMAVAAAALLASCASPGYNARKLEKQLVDAGLSTTQATCVTNALENTYDQGQLGSRSEPTLRELQKTRTLLLACDVDPDKLNPVEG
ncbi:MAG TPA: hypothetical protein VNC41_04620, partial [Acidimicrobiia bacterium]|nr:hypothetical protein [Acidimicrobiia bacterium]